ncbi:MAG: molybdenum ABC transporter ATP-binding protein [Limnohabitans sp.]|nr:molybdenum ABC transporter ATP-binding protein [Limnohabitans sp.]
MNQAPPIDLRLQLERENFSLDVSMTLPGQGITVLFGASGCGKTTVLRCIAGLEKQMRGRIRIGETFWHCDASNIRLATHQRPIGYVFQEASLFEHLNVQQNIEFGYRRTTGERSKRHLDEVVALLGIGHLLARSVATLSGGERQRVAMARALAARPQLLLLDEPMAALDQGRKQDVFPWLERLRDEVRIPMIYVTHSLDELTRLGDHLVVMDNGRIRAMGPVAETLSSLDVQWGQSQDSGVLIAGEVSRLEPVWHLAKVSFPSAHLWVRDNGMKLGDKVRLRVLARDVSITLHEPSGTSIQNHLQAQIMGAANDDHPSQLLVRLRCGSHFLLARITQRAWHTLGLEVGQVVWAQLKAVSVLH